jgi:outer membrane protein OmpA-like peptidoglycan-associated protein
MRRSLIHVVIIPCVAFATLLAAGRAKAATEQLGAAPTATGGFDAESYTPASPLSPYPTIESEAAGADRYGLGVLASYARNPVIRGSEVATQSLGTLNIQGVAMLGAFTALRFNVPVMWVPEGDSNRLFQGARVGDALFSARFRVAGDPQGKGFWVAVSSQARIATGGQSLSMGGTWGIGAALSVGGQPYDWLRLDGEVAGAYATAHRSKISLRAGVAFRAVADLWVPIEFEQTWYPDPREDVLSAAPRELRGGIAWRGRWVSASLFGGAGLNDGVGAPDARVALGFGVTFGAPDREIPMPLPAVATAAPEQCEAAVAAVPPASPQAKGPAPTWLRERTSRLVAVVHFATGSYALDAVADAELDAAARALGPMKAYRVFLSGHTDDVGDDRANDRLSLNRVQAVREALGQRLGRAPGDLSWFGERRPFADNAGDTGRWANRRVEIYADVDAPTN